MLWTDYCRIKEHLELIENSMMRLKGLIKGGDVDAIEMEAVFLESSCRVLRRLRNNTFFDISKIEEEARKILKEVNENGKTRKSI